MAPLPSVIVEGMMLIIRNTVGKRSLNKIEDVAVVQAALKQITVPRQGSLWPGRIDGKATPAALGAAIAAFEAHARLRETGVITQRSQTLRALEQRLPANYRTMHGIPGTAIVAVGVARRAPPRDGGVAGLALPKAFANDLTTMVTRLQRSLGTLASASLGPVDAQGRCPISPRRPPCMPPSPRCSPPTSASPSTPTHPPAEPC